MEEEDYQDEEQNCEWFVILNWRSINLCRIYCFPHHINPSFSCHDVKEGHHRTLYIIEVGSTIDPFSTVV